MWSYPAHDVPLSVMCLQVWTLHTDLLAVACHARPKLAYAFAAAMVRRIAVSATEASEAGDAGKHAQGVLRAVVARSPAVATIVRGLDVANVVQNGTKSSGGGPML